jgi:hypothetical protein
MPAKRPRITIVNGDSPISVLGNGGGTLVVRADLEFELRLPCNGSGKYHRMQAQEIVYFGPTLFLALVVLIKWKRRRDTASERVNRGLRGYVTATGNLEHTGTEEEKENKKESLVSLL